MANQALRYVITADASEAEDTHKRINTQLAMTEQLALQSGRAFGSAIDQMARYALTSAESVGALVIAHRAWRAELEASAAAAASYSVNWGQALNTLRVVRLALAPTALTATTIAAGIVVEESIHAALERNKLIQQQALLAATKSRSFSSVATLASAEDFQGLKSGTLTGLKENPAQIIAAIDELRGISDPVQRAQIAFQTFGDETEKILPLLNDRLKANIESANEFANVYDVRTRSALAGLAELLHKPIDLLHDLADSWRYAKNEASQFFELIAARTFETAAKEEAQGGFLGLLLGHHTAGAAGQARIDALKEAADAAEENKIPSYAELALGKIFEDREGRAITGKDALKQLISEKTVAGAQLPAFPRGAAVAQDLLEGRDQIDSLFGDSKSRLNFLLKMRIWDPGLADQLILKEYAVYQSTKGQAEALDIQKLNDQGRLTTRDALIKAQSIGGTVFDTALADELRQIEEYTRYTDRDQKIQHRPLDPVIAKQLNETLRAALEAEYHKQNLKLFADAEQLERLNKDQFFGGATSQLESDELQKFFLEHELPAATQQFEVPSPTYRYVNGVPTLIGRTPSARAATYAESGFAAESLGGIKESRQEEERLRIEALRNETGLQERLIELSVGPDVRRGIEETYGLRIDYANQEYEIQRLSLGDAMAGYKQGEEYDKARVERAEKLADLERSRLHEISGATESLTHTLFTDPSKFGAQFSRTIRDAFLKPIEEGIGTVVSKVLYPVIYGQEGNGGIRGALSGIFGGKSATRSVEISKLERPNGIGDMELVSGAVPVMIVGASGGGGGGGSVPSLPSGRGLVGGISGGPTAILSMLAPFLLPGLSQAGVGGSGGGGIPAGGVQSIIDFGGGNTYMGAETIYGGTAEGAEAIASSYGGGLSGASSGGGGGIGGLLGRILGGGRGGGGGGFGGFNLAGLKDFIGIGGYKVPGVDTTIPFGDLSSIAKIENIAGSPAAGALGSLLVNKGLRSPGYGGAIESTSGSALLGANIGKSIPGLGIAGGLQVGAGAGLAVHGLITDAGTIKGTLEGAAGGALIGEKFGGPIGALIGAGVGAGIGIGEELAGVESKRAEAVRLIHKIYGVLIDNPLADQVVNLAKQSYGGHVSLAVYSPEIRKIIELFAAATGQRVPQSATTPHGASLVEQGGTLYQERSYNFGLPNVFPSGLPTLGGYSNTPTYGGPAQANVFQFDGPATTALLRGEVVQAATPTFVQSQFANAQNNSDGRLSNSATLQQPGLIVG